jgi:hypothetical protein
MGQLSFTVLTFVIPIDFEGENQCETLIGSHLIFANHSTLVFTTISKHVGQLELIHSWV